MVRLKSIRRLLGWFAIVAILMGTVAPTVSTALHADGDDIWVELCTSSGTVRMAVTDESSHDEPSIAHLSEHCPYCAGNAAMAGPPMSMGTTLRVPGLTAVPPRAFLHAPRTAHAWATAQPRGPPAHA